MLTGVMKCSLCLEGVLCSLREGRLHRSKRTRVVESAGMTEGTVLDSLIGRADLPRSHAPRTRLRARHSREPGGGQDGAVGSEETATEPGQVGGIDRQRLLHRLSD